MQEWIEVPVTSVYSRLEQLRGSKREEFRQLAKQRKVEARVNSAKLGDRINPFVVIVRVNGSMFPISINFLDQLNPEHKRQLGITAPASTVETRV